MAGGEIKGRRTGLICQLGENIFHGADFTVVKGWLEVLSPFLHSARHNWRLNEDFSGLRSVNLQEEVKKGIPVLGANKKYTLKDFKSCFPYMRPLAIRWIL